VISVRRLRRSQVRELKKKRENLKKWDTLKERSEMGIKKQSMKNREKYVKSKNGV
jgi:hypothetical protein